MKMLYMCEVVKWGNSGGVHLPAELVGSKVYVVIRDFPVERR